MSKRESIARYSIIINKLRRHPANFEEIFYSLERESNLQEYNFKVSKRTFQRDLEDIWSLYNINIQYDYSQKVYFIDCDDQPDMNTRMLEAFDTFNALNLSYRLSNHIHFEKRRPQGTEHLYGLLHAIRNQVQIRFVYQKFWEDNITNRVVEPYAVKEFRNRWYVLGRDMNDHQVKSFALDRLSELDITKKKFQLPVDFNVNDHYRYCFGIISPNDDKPEEVVLSFNAFQGKYIKSLPLHESQQVLIDNDQELRVQLTLFITHDFFMELLSYGPNLKVLKPTRLVNDIKKSLEATLKQYQ